MRVHRVFGSLLLLIIAFISAENAFSSSRELFGKDDYTLYQKALAGVLGQKEEDSPLKYSKTPCHADLEPRKRFEWEHIKRSNRGPMHPIYEPRLHLDLLFQLRDEHRTRSITIRTDRSLWVGRVIQAELDAVDGYAVAIGTIKSVGVTVFPFLRGREFGIHHFEVQLLNGRLMNVYTSEIVELYEAVSKGTLR